MLRCKACGLLVREDEPGEICPACGVPKKAFEPYRDPVSPARRRLIDLHIHPIVVHFPQAFSVAVPAFIAGAAVLPAPWDGELIAAAKVLALLMPPAVAASIAAGIFDGKARFKKIGRPFLVRKIVVAGAVVFTASLVMAGSALAGDFGATARAVAAACGAVCMAAEIYLAKIGVRLMYAELGG